MKGFDHIFGEKSSEQEEMILSQVEPRTAGSKGQGSREWFLDRAFSGTSSTMFKLICVLAGDIKAKNDGDSNIQEHLQTVLDFCGHDLNQAQENENDTPSQSNTTTAAATATATVAATVPATSPATVAYVTTPAATTTTLAMATATAAAAAAVATNSGAVSNINTSVEIDGGGDDDGILSEADSWFDVLTTHGEDLSFEEDFKQKLYNNEISNTTMKELLSKIKKAAINNRSTAEANKNKLLEWLTFPREQRPYKNIVRTKLYEIAKARKLNGVNSNTGKEKLIEKLIEYDKTPSSTRNTSSTSSSDVQAFAAFINCSLLQPQKTKLERDAAIIGHDNEKPFIEKFVDCCLVSSAEEGNGQPERYGFSSFGSVQAVYRPGLVRKKDKQFVKGSADGLIFRKKVRHDLLLLQKRCCCLRKTHIIFPE